jgi:hypothetical protein
MEANVNTTKRAGFHGYTHTQWTEAQVKEQLPDVPVKLGRDQYAGIVTGRKNQFATVFIVTDSGIISHDVAWATIVENLNRRSSITF